MFDVVALGEALIDFSMLGADADGYPLMQAHPGGAPANFLAAVNRCGGRTAMLAKVGDDVFGRLLVKTLEGVGIDTSGVLVSKEFFTTLAFVTLDENGDRDFSFARKPGADTQISFPEMNLSLIDSARVFHFGTLSLTDEPARSATVKVVSYAKAAGKLVTCDPNLRKPLWRDLDEAKRQMLWAVSAADVVKISDEEGEFLFGCGPEEAARILVKDYDVKLAFVTCGSKGAAFENRNAAGFVSAPEVVPVDTTGAGDIFGGTAVYYLLKTGKAPEDLNLQELSGIAGAACKAASLSTERPGGLW